MLNTVYLQVIRAKKKKSTVFDFLTNDLRKREKM